MSGLKYYILDTETTGLVAGKHEVNQISIIRCEDRVQLTRNIICERPENADLRALDIQGLSLRDIKKGIPKKQVVQDVIDFFNKDELTPEHRVIVAHNASFDRRHTHALFREVGIKFPAILWLDTQKIAKEWAKRKGLGKVSVALKNALTVLDIKPVNSGLHQALPDTQNTYLLWYKAGQAGIDSLPYIKRHPDNIVSEEELEMDFE